MADSNYFATSLFVSCSWYNTPYLQTHKSTVPPPAPSLHLIQDAMKVHQPGLLTFTYCSFCCADCLHCQMNASSSSRWQQQPPLYIYVELFFVFIFIFLLLLTPWQFAAPEVNLPPFSNEQYDTLVSKVKHQNCTVGSL